MKKFIDENKKKIIALILALILAATGLTLSPDMQDKIVNGASDAIPVLDHPAAPVVAVPAPVPAPAQ